MSHEKARGERPRVAVTCGERNLVATMCGERNHVAPRCGRMNHVGTMSGVRSPVARTCAARRLRCARRPLEAGKKPVRLRAKSVHDVTGTAAVASAERDPQLEIRRASCVANGPRAGSAGPRHHRSVEPFPPVDAMANAALPAEPMANATLPAEAMANAALPAAAVAAGLQDRAEVVVPTLRVGGARALAVMTGHGAALPQHWPIIRKSRRPR
ncbi:MAG TPA: hypothetical protein VFP10_11140 [Candidatus Eisenbacteria bacterium]|nr:hypothetical protein [Candidatus Eisenbacteria bacterium]